MKNLRFALPIIIATAMLASCGTRAPSEEQTAGIALEEMPIAPAIERSVPKEVIFEDEAMEQEVMQDEAGGISERIVIKNASLSIIVEEPADSIENISNLAESMGGFVVNSYLYKTTTSAGIEVPTGNITIRVPADALDEAIIQIKTEVVDPEIDILNEEVSGQDVTREVTDLESRLRNLQAAEEQLLEIMDTATDAEDVIQIFQELTEVREEIEVIQGQIQYYRESARLSAISVNLQAKEAVEPITIGRWQPGVELQRALRALLEAGKFLVNALIWLVIFALPILAVIFLPIYLVVRFIKKRKKSEDNKTGDNNK